MDNQHEIYLRSVSLKPLQAEPSLADGAATVFFPAAVQSKPNLFKKSQRKHINVLLRRHPSCDSESCNKLTSQNNSEREYLNSGGGCMKRRSDN